jgi:hypothetical protein
MTSALTNFTTKSVAFCLASEIIFLLPGSGYEQRAPEVLKWISTIPIYGLGDWTEHFGINPFFIGLYCSDNSYK